MNDWYATGSSTFAGPFRFNARPLGRQASLKVKMDQHVRAADVLTCAAKAAHDLWPDAPADTARPMMAVLLASIAREVQRRGQGIEFVIERDGYRQTVDALRPPPPPDGEWPVPWFAVIDTQRDQLR